MEQVNEDKEWNTFIQASSTMRSYFHGYYYRENKGDLKFGGRKAEN